jgi:hypothetical protein
LLCLLLPGCGGDQALKKPLQPAGTTAETGSNAVSPATEDERLLAFFEEIFERDVSQSPNSRQLGRKTKITALG